MEKKDVFHLVHMMELFNNRAMIEWNKSFSNGIGISPILVLSTLKQEGPQKQSVLADELGFTPGAMTNISDRLIKEGLAVRKYDESDRRVILMAITSEGEHVLQEANKKGKDLYIHLFQVLTDEEIQQFTSIYDKLAHEHNIQDSSS